MSAAPSTFWNSTNQPVTKSQGVLPLLSFLFPSVHFAFYVLSIYVFLCSFMPLCEKNSCCQFVLFFLAGLLPYLCGCCPWQLLHGLHQHFSQQGEVERSHQCFPISPSKETSWQGRWSSGILPWCFQFSHLLFSNPSASSVSCLHQAVNDRKWAGPSKPAVPWQLLDPVLDLWDQSRCWAFWSWIYTSDVSLPSSTETYC